MVGLRAGGLPFVTCLMAVGRGAGEQALRRLGCTPLHVSRHYCRGFAVGYRHTGSNKIPTLLAQLSLKFSEMALWLIGSYADSGNLAYPG